MYGTSISTEVLEGLERSYKEIYKFLPDCRPPVIYSKSYRVNNLTWSDCCKIWNIEVSLVRYVLCVPSLNQLTGALSSEK